MKKLLIMSLAIMVMIMATGCGEVKEEPKNVSIITTYENETILEEEILVEDIIVEDTITYWGENETSWDDKEVYVSDEYLEELGFNSQENNFN